LERGGSVWTVARYYSASRLERRLDATTVERAESGTSAPGRASEHLARAWAVLYKRNPEPDLAYGEAVKAVETAGRAVVLPNDAGATLGKIVNQLRATQGQWSFALEHPGGSVGTKAIGGIPMVLTMIDQLWECQIRHGNTQAPAVETVARAEAALHLALTLVHWFRSGAIVKK